MISIVANRLGVSKLSSINAIRLLQAYNSVTMSGVLASKLFVYLP